MRLLLIFARAYPYRSILALFALLIAGLAEGLGLTTLLPLFINAVDTRNGPVAGPPAGDSESTANQLINQVLGWLNLTPSIGNLLLLLVFGLLIKAILVLWAHKHVGYTVAHVATDLRLALIRALLGSRWEYYLRQPVGSLANSIATEATRASQAYLFGANLAAMMIQVVIFTVVALMVSWRAILVALLAAGLFFGLLNRLVRSAKKAGRRQTALLKSLLSRLTDSLHSAKPLKAMGRENLADAFLRNETRQLNRALRREVFSKQALKSLQEPLVGILIAAGLYVALQFYDMTLSAVLVLTLLITRILLQMTKMQQRYQEMVVCKSAYWSIQRTIEEAQAEAEPDTGRRRAGLDRDLRFDNVSFTYRDEEWVLRNLSFEIPAGTLTTFMGGSGAGKTTIIDLIIGLLRPQRGRILVDGVPLSEMDMHHWRRSIGYVPQDTFLLHDTVLDNVTLSDPELTEADAEQALRSAGIWEVISALPEGASVLLSHGHWHTGHGC